MTSWQAPACHLVIKGAKFHIQSCTNNINKLELSKRNFTRTVRKQSESEQSKSAIADHAVQRNHVINWQDVKILDKEYDRDVRHIKEAIWIRRRAPRTMNRDEGAHFLSHIFDPLLTTDRPTFNLVLLFFL